jgi:very-short-patch-repair endonuclease
MKNLWDEKEIKYLKENYPNTYNRDIAKVLKKSESSVYNKAFKLGLKKTKDFKSYQVGQRNKMVGRDLNYENLKNIAKNYKSRGEFQHKDSSAYSRARAKGYLDDICKHMINVSYSIPQLILSEICKKFIGKINYNTRKIIKPYELDIYIPKYKIAFEYDGKGWHDKNKRKNIDNIKDGLCKENNILLIRIKENNRRYEEDVKNQFINNLNLINNYCGLEITKKDILEFTDYNYMNSILDDKKIKEIVNKYKYYTDFRKNEINLYNKIRKLNTLEKYTGKLIRTRILWNVEKVKKEVENHYTLNSLIVNANGCYNYIKRNKLEYLIKDLKRGC